EFTNRENRNWVDSLADGFNRLVRPLIASTVIFVFVLAYVNPEYFARVTLALSSIPNGYWALLSVIIGFYFGGRMQIKSQDFEFRQSQVDAVKALIETKKEFRQLEMDNDEPDKLAGDSLGKSDAVGQARLTVSNRVIDTFLKTAAPERDAQLKAVVQQIADPVDDPVRRVLGGD
ncbi:MAG TPA: 3TM-type holin, partial [Rhodocyclaceae bacterium]